MCVVILALIPLSVIFLEGLFSFIITSILVILQGFANSIFISSMYGICGFLPFKFIIGMSTGNGFAGLGVNIIRYIILFIYGNDTSRKTITTGSLWFFGIATLILTMGLVLLPLMTSHPYFKIQFYKSGEISEEDYRKALSEYGLSEEQELTKKDINNLSDDEEEVSRIY